MGHHCAEWLELGRYIGSTHNRGQSRPSEQSAIGDQSVSMFHDEVTLWIHLAMGSIGHPCSTIQGSMQYLSLMTPGPFSINSFDQANNPCSTVQVLRGYPSFDQAVLLLPCWTIHSLSQAWIECGNTNIIGPPSHRLYRQGISCHRYAIFNRQNDKEKT